jgi:hypothetical protein
LNKKENELKEKREDALQNVVAEITSKQIEFNELKSEEKVIRNTRFYENEIKQLETELAELRAVTYKNRSEKAIKSNLVQTLQKEWEETDSKLKQSLSNQIAKINKRIITKTKAKIIKKSKKILYI